MTESKNQIYFVDNGTRHKEDFLTLLRGCSICELSPDRLDLLHPSPNGVIILSGGNKTVVGKDHRDRSHQIAKVIQDTKVPVIGVCQGSQQIAFTFKSLLQTKEDKARIQGMRRVTVIEPHPIFDGISGSFNAYFGHKWFVRRENIRSPLIPLAVDEDGRVAIMIHRSKPWIIGMQFHPEVETTDTTRLFWQNTLNYASRVAPWYQ